MRDSVKCWVLLGLCCDILGFNGFVGVYRCVLVYIVGFNYIYFIHLLGLLNFSYIIIGFYYLLYRFKKGSIIPSIQYIPFVAVRTMDSSSSQENNSSNSCILEGHNLHELPAEYSIKLLLPIDNIVDFRTAACPLGDCE